MVTNKKSKSSFLLMLLIPLSVIAIAAGLLCKTPYFYTFEFERLKVFAEMQLQTTPREMGALFSQYMNGEVEDFQVIANYKGENREVFNEKEIAHMEDVKKVANGVMGFGIICALGALGLSIACYLKNKRLLRQGLKGSLAFFAAVLIFFAILSSLDFNKGFTVFHEIFFTNDLWRLNPNQDLLLMMMPLSFFMDGLICLLALSVILLGLVGVFIWQLTKETEGKR